MALEPGYPEDTPDKALHITIAYWLDEAGESFSRLVSIFLFPSRQRDLLVDFFYRTLTLHSCLLSAYFMKQRNSSALSSREDENASLAVENFCETAAQIDEKIFVTRPFALALHKVSSSSVST